MKWEDYIERVADGHLLKQVFKNQSRGNKDAGRPTARWRNEVGTGVFVYNKLFDN